MSHSSPPEHASAGARQIEHTADLALEIWGPDEPAMLAAGANAIVEILTQGATVNDAETRAVRLEAVDAEDRLVRWLSEVLYWASVEGFVVARAVLEVTPDGLVGTAHGTEGAGSLLKIEIKAATYHDLRVVRDSSGVRARIVLDV